MIDKKTLDHISFCCHSNATLLKSEVALLVEYTRTLADGMQLILGLSKLSNDISDAQQIALEALNQLSFKE